MQLSESGLDAVLSVAGTFCKIRPVRVCKIRPLQDSAVWYSRKWSNICRGGDRVFMHSVCQIPLKLDEFICLTHCRLCNVTIAHTSIAMTMRKRYIVQL